MTVRARPVPFEVLLWVGYSEWWLMRVLLQVRPDGTASGLVAVSASREVMRYLP